MGFADDVKRLSNSILKSSVDSVESITNDLFSLIVEKTPVDSGLLQQSWKKEIVSPAPNSSVVITNSQPYAFRVEYGSSSKAPSGMVRISMIEILRRIQSGNYSKR